MSIGRADSRQQTADSRQQTADRRQETADSRQQTAESREQTADSRQERADGGDISDLIRRLEPQDKARVGTVGGVTGRMEVGGVTSCSMTLHVREDSRRGEISSERAEVSKCWKRS